MDNLKKFISHDEILSALDIQSEEVHVPEWGGWVIVRGLTGAERDALEADIVEMRGRKQHINLNNTMAKLASRCIVDQDGKRMFSNDEVAALGRKSSAALQRIVKVAQRLSALSEDDMEDLAKNSGSGPDGASPSD